MINLCFEITFTTIHEYIIVGHKIFTICSRAILWKLLPISSCYAHCTDTALLEKTNVQGTPLDERFWLRLLNSSEKGSVRKKQRIAWIVH